MGLRRYITGIWIPTCGLMTIPFYGTINNMRPWHISWKERFQWRNMWISNAASKILSMTQPIFGDTLVDGTNPKQIETIEIQPLEASALVAFQKHGRNTGLKGAFEAHFQSASRTKIEDHSAEHVLISWCESICTARSLSLSISYSRGSFALNCLGWYSHIVGSKLSTHQLFKTLSRLMLYPSVAILTIFFWNRISYPWLLRLFWKGQSITCWISHIFRVSQSGIPQKNCNISQQNGVLNIFGPTSGYSHDIPWYSPFSSNPYRAGQLVPLRRRLGDGTSCPGRRSCQDSEDFCGFGDPHRKLKSQQSFWGNPPHLPRHPAEELVEFLVEYQQNLTKLQNHSLCPSKQSP